MLKFEQIGDKANKHHDVFLLPKINNDQRETQME